MIGDEALLRGLPDEIERNTERYNREKKPRRPLRKDTLTLLAGSASFPKTGDLAQYPKWRDLTVKWLQEKYGDALRVVLEHNDEPNPHLHFYCIDADAVNVKKRLHDGYVAKADGQLYNDAMRLMQDDYYKKVGVQTGLARLGPRRARLSRTDYKSAAADAAMLAEVLSEACTQFDLATVERAANEAERNRLAMREAKLKKREEMVIQAAEMNKRLTAGASASLLKLHLVNGAARHALEHEKKVLGFEVEQAARVRFDVERSLMPQTPTPTPWDTNRAW